MAEFKSRLKEAMEHYGISQAELAKKSGLWPSAISDYLNGKYLAKQDKVDILAKALNVSPIWLMGIDDGNGDKELDLTTFDNIHPITTKKIPLLGEIACGEPLFADEDRESYIEIGTDIKADFCLRAVGDSMIGARIHDGDIVFIRQQESVDNGQVAAVIIEGEATLKRVFYTSGKRLVLQSENNAFPPLVFENEDLNGIRIIGKAIAFQSDVI